MGEQGRIDGGDGSLRGISRERWLELATTTTALTERQAEALYRRVADQQGRRKVADIMDSSASNVDNLERAAHSKIIDAQNLIALARAIDAVPEEEVTLGLCPECNQPASALVPTDDGRSICEECADESDE